MKAFAFRIHICKQNVMATDSQSSHDHMTRLSHIFWWSAQFRLIRLEWYYYTWVGLEFGLQPVRCIFTHTYLYIITLAWFPLSISERCSSFNLFALFNSSYFRWWIVIKTCCYIPSIYSGEYFLPLLARSP